MKSYIFITKDGCTFQPGNEDGELNIENCQVIGFAEGRDEKESFKNLIKENEYLLETTFDEITCLELKHRDYDKYSQAFCLTDYKDTKVKR